MPLYMKTPQLDTESCNLTCLYMGLDICVTIVVPQRFIATHVGETVAGGGGPLKYFVGFCIKYCVDCASSSDHLSTVNNPSQLAPLD
jgi:hypothetical protein